MLREKAALHTLQPHEYIASLLATFQDVRSLFLVLQLGLGGDLRGSILRERRRSIVSGSGGMAEGSVCFYAAVLVLVLQHIHGRGLVYRDLKPENVLLDAEGQPLLCDFGTAVHLGEAGRSMSTLGTWEYAPPEMLRSLGVTCAADWWSLGVIVLECLLGDTPFPSGDDDSPAAVLSSISAFDAQELPTSLSPEAQALVGMLLQVDEQKRWAASRRVREQSFFANTDWELLARREVAPPYRPILLGAADTRNFSHCSLDESDAKRVGAPLSASPEWGGGVAAFGGEDRREEEWHHSCWDDF